MRMAGVRAASTRATSSRAKRRSDAAATRTGGCAGAGTCSAPAVGTSELAGVGTRPAFRGRGVAGAVTAALAEALFAGGARSVWLEYSGEGSRQVYERVGFRPGGTRLYMALEDGHGGAANRS